MNFLEKNLEDIIFDTPNERLQERGLDISGIKKRQVWIGNYGTCDLLSISRELYKIYITVFELKKEQVDVNTFLQAIRYTKGVKSFFEKNLSNRGFHLEINTVLIGSCFDNKNGFCYLPEFANVTIYTYEYNFDGISFKELGTYALLNEGF